MKKYRVLIPILLALTSCQELIELDLQSAGPRVVAEANLDATKGRCTVALSQSGDFYETNTLDKIEGASVQLNASTGEIWMLKGLGNGQYYLDNLVIVPGMRFGLNVVLPGGTSIGAAEVQAPVWVGLDTLMVEKTADGGLNGSPGAGKYTLTAVWQDHAGEANYYRLKIYKNGALQAGTYILADDRLGDGETIMRPVIRETYSLGDTLRVQLLSVSKGYYDYFTDMANFEGRGLSAPTPFNPKSNWSDDILGYYGVWQVSEKTVLVQ